MYLCKNLSLGTFLGCSYFFTKFEADVLINSVLRQNTACMSEHEHRQVILSVYKLNSTKAMTIQWEGQ